MKNHLRHFISVVSTALILSGCSNYKKLLTDEIVLRDGNSQTGTIVKCDSVQLKLKKPDESISIINWSDIDTIQGKKLKTLWFGINYGYYKTPYFSVFRNEAFTGKAAGIQLKAGFAMRGTRLFYTHLSYTAASPYDVTKFGFGYQKYLGASTYIRKNTFFVGGELNFMNVKMNNGSQTTLEPFTGFERKLNEHLRIHFKFGMQLNLANKNQQVGFNTTIGIHFMRRNFKKYYNTLNQEHRIPRK